MEEFDTGFIVDYNEDLLEISKKLEDELVGKENILHAYRIPHETKLSYLKNGEKKFLGFCYDYDGNITCRYEKFPPFVKNHLNEDQHYLISISHEIEKIIDREVLKENRANIINRYPNVTHISYTDIYDDKKSKKILFKYDDQGNYEILN